GAVAVARCLVRCMAGAAGSPRPEGTGKVLIEATRGWEVGLFAAVAAGLTLAATGCDPVPALVLFLPPLLAVLALTALCRRRLGGVTRDCLRAAVETPEGGFFLAAGPRLPPAPPPPPS